MDYILFLERHGPFTYGHYELVDVYNVVEELREMVRQRGLRLLEVKTTADTDNEGDYTDYVIEVPHALVEEVGLSLKRSQDVYNVIVTREHDETADWDAVIRSYDRRRDVPIVRIRTLSGH